MRPSNLAITMAGLNDRWLDGQWLAADQIRGRLKLLGFDVTAQQVAAWLAVLCREDAPRFERRSRIDWWEYRVTQYGRNDIDNRFPGVKA